MILHARKEQVDRLDLEEIDYYISGREDTLRKISLIFVSSLRILSALDVA